MTPAPSPSPSVTEGEARRAAADHNKRANAAVGEALDDALQLREAWEHRERELRAARIGVRPTLEHVRDRTGSRTVRATVALVTLSPTLTRDAAHWCEWTGSGSLIPDPARPDLRVLDPDPWLDVEGWAADVDARGRGWSSGEWALWDLAAGVGVPGRRVDLRALTTLGSWQVDALHVLTRWATAADVEA